MKLRCGRCKRTWEYKGSRKHYTSCPDCKTNVKLGESKQ